ncbi:hypothetical protein MKQ70_25470 [Chitinophaga sedimenti]|uniref:hypothetical protein n=1 Tax=Chitinophaga sedimenti TaxID=2033606 RepID=UPI002004AF3F|nr:hypothetical protein [Chitinophaga sedimenti]MCK7558174.1 hypothetical protein [Chitinophaga sedimenti]
MTTDADCVMGEKWIETFVRCYETSHPKFIAAPVSFYKEDNFFKHCQSLDFMTMQGITGAMAYLKSGTMQRGQPRVREAGILRSRWIYGHRHDRIGR